MDENVIRSEKLDKHNIESYHFKVLGSNLSANEDEADIIPPKPAPMPRKKVKEAPETSSEEKPLEEAPQQSAGDGSFVEKLLKKTDELSSNIIKLQMQIESQEEEFNKRLEDETARIKEESVKDGYEKAKAENEEQMKAFQAQYLRSVKLLEAEAEKFKEFTAKNQAELTSAALDVAKEVIKQEVDKDSAKIASSLAKALMDELEESVKVTLKVNPKDFEELKNEYEQNDKINVLSDEAISQGGVIVMSEVGNVDGTLDVRLGKIKQMMEE